MFKRVKIIQIIGSLLVFVYLGLFVSNVIFGYLGALDTFIFSILLVAIGFDLIWKGVLLKSSSTLWFAICLILWAILILILKLYNQNIQEYIFVFASIPLIPSALNMIVFKNSIYLKVIIINIFIIVPILLMQFLTLSWWWLVLIATASVGVSIVICRFIGLKRGRSGKV
ncbi:MAG: hypothetical protein SPK63_04455 [Eubacteriales bacterium]|nr:hypothetical protein [Eubacteriales bacterium]